MAKMDIALKKCITPEFRVSFPAVFKPKAFQDQEPKFSVVMMFSKKTDLKLLRAAANNAAREKWGDDKSKWPKKMKNPFRDGDEERSETPGYENTNFVTCSSKSQPGLVDQRRQPILSEQDFYAGCYARAEVIAFAYDTAGNRGVSFSLQNLQKLRDGDKLSGKRNAEDVFDAVDDGSDDAGSYDATGSSADGDEDTMGF